MSDLAKLVASIKLHAFELARRTSSPKELLESNEENLAGLSALASDLADEIGALAIVRRGGASPSGESDGETALGLCRVKCEGLHGPDMLIVAKDTGDLPELLAAIVPRGTAVDITTIDDSAMLAAECNADGKIVSFTSGNLSRMISADLVVEIAGKPMVVAIDGLVTDTFMEA